MALALHAIDATTAPLPRNHCLMRTQASFVIGGIAATAISVKMQKTAFVFGEDAASLEPGEFAQVATQCASIIYDDTDPNYPIPSFNTDENGNVGFFQHKHPSVDGGKSAHFFYWKMYDDDADPVMYHIGRGEDPSPNKDGYLLTKISCMNDAPSDANKNKGGCPGVYKVYQECQAVGMGGAKWCCLKFYCIESWTPNGGTLFGNC